MLPVYESISAVTLLVANMGTSMKFYNSLGFEVLFGGADANFTSLRVGAGFLNLQVDVLSTVAPGAPWGRVVIWVGDVDAVYRKVVSCGWKTETVPEDAPWGERYFHVRDPDGHELSFARPIS